MKIRPLGAELFLADGNTDGRTDGRTDMMKLIVVFRNFAKVPKNEVPRCAFTLSAPLRTYFPLKYSL